MAQSVYYPAPAFSFSVAVAGLATPLQMLSRADASFQEVSGIEAKMKTEAVCEGGENRYVHQLPAQGEYPNLVLKRGYVTASSFLSEWATQAVGATQANPVMTQTLLVFLLGEGSFPLVGSKFASLGLSRQPLVAWSFTRAWPIRWVTGPFNANENAVLTEVMEFSYAYVTRIPLTMAAAMTATVATMLSQQRSANKVFARLRK